MKNVLISCVAIIGLAPCLQADLTEVTPSNMNGWSFLVFDGNADPCPTGPPTCGTASMVTGPATPPLGVGSASLTTPVGGGDGASTINYGGYDQVALSSLTALSYSTYETVNNGQQFPYLQLQITFQNDANNDGPGSDTLTFEPPYQTPSTGNALLPNQGSPVLNEWQTWNALEGGWYGNDLGGPGTGVVSWSQILAFYDDAVISDSSSNAVTYFGGDSLNLLVGFASSGDTFNGNVDNVTVGVSGVNTTFDFDPNSSVPEPFSILLLATVCAGIGIVTRGKLFRA